MRPTVDQSVEGDLGASLCNAEVLLGEGATGADVGARRLRSPMAEFCAEATSSPPTVSEEDYSFGPNLDCRRLYWKIPRFIRRYLPRWMRLRGSFKLQLRNQLTITQERESCPECLAVDEVTARNDLSFDFCGAGLHRVSQADPTRRMFLLYSTVRTCTVFTDPVCSADSEAPPRRPAPAGQRARLRKKSRCRGLGPGRRSKNGTGASARATRGVTRRNGRQRGALTGAC